MRILLWHGERVSWANCGVTDCLFYGTEGFYSFAERLLYKKGNEDTVRININGAFVRCNECGCGDFERKAEAKVAQLPLLHCAHCGQGVAYEDLIQRIGVQATAPWDESASR